MGCLLTVVIDAFSTTADIETEIQYGSYLETNSHIIEIKDYLAKSC